MLVSPLRSSENAPSITFSSTESCGKCCTSWNVRTRPFCAIRSGGVPGLDSNGVALMLQVINSTTELKLAASEIQDPVVVRALADRMGVEPTSRRLRMVNAVWSAIIVTGCGDLTPGTAAGELGPELMALRISESYDQFRALTAVAR